MITEQELRSKSLCYGIKATNNHNQSLSYFEKHKTLDVYFQGKSLWILLL